MRVCDYLGETLHDFTLKASVLNGKTLDFCKGWQRSGESGAGGCQSGFWTAGLASCRASSSRLSIKRPSVSRPSYLLSRQGHRMSPDDF